MYKYVAVFTDGSVLQHDKGTIEEFLEKVAGYCNEFKVEADVCVNGEYYKSVGYVVEYRIYRHPKNPTENGKYYGKTPNLEQAKGVVERAREQELELFIKAIYSDGEERYL